MSLGNIGFGLHAAKTLPFAPNRIGGLALWSGDMETDQAARFHAADQSWMQVENNPSVQTGDINFTWAGWVNFATLADNQTIFSKWNTADSNRQYWLRFHSGTLGFLVSATGSSGITERTSTAAISANQWYFVIAWHDSDTDQIAISVNNGTPDTIAHSGGVYVSTDPLAFGARVTVGGATSDFGDVRLDSWGFWKRLLTSSERTALYNAGQGMTSHDLTPALLDNLVSWWDFNEAKGTRFDAVGNNHLTEHLGEPVRYISNFSSGVDEFSVYDTNLSEVTWLASYEGKSGVLFATTKANSGARGFRRTSESFYTLGRTYKVSMELYVPTSNASSVPISFSISGFSWIGNGNYTKGSWQTITRTAVADRNGHPAFFHGFNTDDVLAVKSIEIREVVTAIVGAVGIGAGKARSFPINFRTDLTADNWTPNAGWNIGSGLVASFSWIDAYIKSVEAADGQSLETPVSAAMHDFLHGCRIDGLLDAIQAGCLLAGPRTLAGALTPLRGPAPTNINFVAADHSRSLGLVGDSGTKRIHTNRANNADPQNDYHRAVWVSVPDPATGGIRGHIGGSDTTDYLAFHASLGRMQGFSRTTDISTLSGIQATGLWGLSRSQATTFIWRANGVNYNNTRPSQTPSAGGVAVFAANEAGSFAGGSTIAAYTMGRALDLAVLDVRLDAYMAAIQEALA